MPPWGRCKGCRAGWPLSPIVPNASQPSRSRPAARPQAVAPAPAPEAVPAGAGAERLAGPAPPGRGAQAGRAATLLRLQVVLGNRAVQRLVQSPQAQAAPVPPVQRAEPGQEGAGGSAGAGSEAPVPAGEAGAGGSGGAGGTGGAPPAGASPEAAAQIAYAQAINQQVPPLSPEHTARLGAVIGDARVYGLIVERDTKKGQLQEWTTILQGHGTIPGKTVDELAGMAGDLAAEIKRLDGEIKEQLPALGVADEAQLAERVERQFPELFVARARQIALVILDQNQTDVLREFEPLRGVSEHGHRRPAPGGGRPASGRPGAGPPGRRAAPPG